MPAGQMKFHVRWLFVPLKISVIFFQNSLAWYGVFYEPLEWVLLSRFHSAAHNVTSFLNALTVYLVGCASILSWAIY